MTQTEFLERVEAVRRFNRFYTRQIGVLHEKLLKSPFPLTEARVIYELAQREKTTAADLCRELGLDPGYLSRLLRGFKKRGLVLGRPSRTDGRRTVLSLTDRGQAAFAALNSDSRHEIGVMIDRLSPAEQARLVEAMEVIQGLLAARPETRVSYILRPHQPGDMGWVAHRHGLLYAQEYGWNEEFEALVAEITAKFIQNFTPRKERCWMAERYGQIVGSVFLVKQTEETAKLRLLLVEPEARGLGIGRRLVEECLRFAKQSGYQKITLWTNSVLLAARRIYEQAGFRLVQEEPHHSFGHDLIGENWEREV